MRRPLGLSIIAILGFICGFVMVLSGIAITVIPWMLESVEITIPLLLKTLFGVAGLLILIFGMFFLVLSYGLWSGKSWAWWTYVVLLALGILSSLFLIPILPLVSISLVIYVVVLYYMTRRNVRKYFGI